MKNWENAQNWEKHWWGTCQNTYGEEEKQLLYANRMGLQTFHDGKSPYNFDLQGKSVLDIGGGACSLLLKCVNVKGKVVDPLEVPEWVGARYKLAGIRHSRDRGEVIVLPREHFDEVWIYNVLQHTDDPETVIRRAREAGDIVRLFEWIDTPTNDGHPNSLTEKDLNEWLGGEGKVEILNLPTLKGKCYYGIFLCQENIDSTT